MILWDDLKGKIREASIAYCRERGREKKEVLEKLQRSLAALDYSDPKDQDLACKYREELKNIAEEECSKLAVRSRVQKELLDEKCSGYFFNRIRERRRKNFISEVRNAEGNIVNRQEEIQKAFAVFYENLYTGCEGDSQEQTEFLECLEANQLASEGECEGSGVVTFAVEDIVESIKGFKNNKTPGPDGLPIEFYRSFREDLVPDLQEVFQAVADDEMKPQTMNEAVTVLLAKSGDLAQSSNWRPISLLNVDYKILTKLIDQQFVKSILQKIVSAEQTSAVPGRSIHDNLCLVRDVIEYYRERNESGFIMCLDQKKAFDVVNREFLFSILERVGAQDGLIKILRCLYSGTTTSIQINGHLSEKVCLNRGVRQGCPLSPSLYTLYIQSVIQYIKHRSALKGLPIPGGSQLKVSAFADDLVVFCKDSCDQAEVFSCFEKFRLATGSSLNKRKTEVLPLNSSCRSQSQYAVEEIKILGVKYAVDSQEGISERNFLERRKKMGDIVERLKRFQLSLPGKVLLINSIVNSQIHYMSGVYPLRSKWLEEVRRLCFSFIWNGSKREPIKRIYLECSKDKGGLGLEYLPARCSSFFLINSFMRPMGENFDHQRLGLFKYFFGMWARRFNSKIYSLSEPHSFQLQGVYKDLQLVIKKLEDRLILLGPIQVSSSQVYTWLKEEEEDVPLVFDLDDQKRAHLHSVWGDGTIPAPLKCFMWRLGLGALKTGSFVAKYNMPGMKTSCMFCVGNLETPAHLFLECLGLRHVRGVLIDCVKSIGCSTVITADDTKTLLSFGLCPAAEDRNIQRAVFKLVSQGHRMLWMARNERLFGPGTGDLSKVCAIVRKHRDDILSGMAQR